ncbi:NADH-quinone oxidoreductase subunit C [Eikenella corrodens]|uniref:NADH-quinone oxidoreductase subunit C n=1 Tax=Eikenella corrodens TaxID=539 RepID=UPI0007D0B720|nr:NADH-quinone oxidoreductase subunit C [Eikenella corrodens]OAM33454.1 NADH-quinone oxidoreductase subunit C [Eikenella corrodens]
MHPKDLYSAAQRILEGKADKVLLALDEVTVECRPEYYLDIMQTLRDHEEMYFELLVDLCGVDYSTYKNEPWSGKRFAVVSQLLSVKNNQRIRVRVWAENDDFPLVQSVINIYNSADWYEREAFDMYGIVFENHPDLRRILTDYGFVGHPFRKDFPISGYVEMRYDETEKRVIYQPVTIEPREITPRVVREENYGGH